MQILDSEDIEDTHISELDEISSKIKIGSVAEKTKAMGLSGKVKDTWLFENAYRICRSAASASILNLAEEKYPGASPDIFAVRSRSRKTAYLIRGNYSRASKKPRIQLIFAEDNLSMHPGDLWLDIKTTGLEAEGQVEFKNGKKPEHLVRRVIAMATEPGDLVMDSFLGSGTTAAVAQKMGRRWIGIEMGEHAVTHCAPRLRKVADGEQGGISKTHAWQGGGGFRFYRLGPPVFDETGAIRPDIRFPVLAAHIWFAETCTPWTAPRHPSPFLGVHKGRGYALLYNGVLGDRSSAGGNTLTRRTLATIRAAQGDFNGPLTIYGARSALAGATLQVGRITFRQTPYDVRAHR
ncbi:MAG: site-specific DNA-methyltransferase [Rhodobacteraceae bacterium]|nr:site-specific DNA-methyltransferase [Paracoccaceae bacterium]